MKKAIVAIVIILVLASIVVVAYVRQRGPSAGMGASGRGMGSFPVEIALVENGSIAKRIVANGTINARAEVEIYPKQTGELVALLVDKGDRVKAGQVLARIDPTTFEIQLKQAKADLASAQAAYDKSSPLASINSETDFKQAKSNRDRLQSMLKQAELDLQLQEKQADVQVKKATADLRIAQARLRAAVSGARDQELEQAKVKAGNSRRELDRLVELLADEMISQDQVETAQLQYDIYKAQLSLLEEGARPEDIEVLKAQVETAKASSESAKNNKLLTDIKQSSLDAANAQVDSAQAAFDQASAAWDVSTWEKDLAQAEASVQRAAASLEMVQQHLDDSIIKAPVSGIISQRFLDKGDTASLSRPFVTIVDMDVVRIPAKVQAEYIVDIDPGDRADVTPDAYPGQTFHGIVSNISPVVDRASQTCDIEIELANPDYRLKPGMFTRVQLTALELTDVPIIPVDVLSKEGEEMFVYVVDGDKASRRKVITGISDDIKIQILSGLEVGEEFVIAGYKSLRPGVSVVQTGGKGGAADGKPAGDGKGGKQ